MQSRHMNEIRPLLTFAERSWAATTPQIAVLILAPHTLLDWVRSRACSKSSQMSGGKASSLAVMRFIAMRLAVFTTP